MPFDFLTEVSPSSGSLQPYGYRSSDHYGINAKFRVRLFEDNPTATLDFLQQTASLMRELNASHVLNIWIGRESVFRTREPQENTNTRDEDDNMQQAFSAAESRPELGAAHRIGVTCHGFGESFETRCEFELHMKNPAQAQTIFLRMFALPIQLSWRPNEGVVERVERLNSFLADKQALRTMNDEASELIAKKLSWLEIRLQETYGASEVKYDFSVDLASIVW
ncbi:MAG TPA: hypothetical protein VGS04_00845 [Nitrososphaerales archaeon]|nr:hypothetical protein [Nitrososphaerales archaeon]